MDGASTPLWGNLSRGEHYRYIARFMHLDPAALSLVEVSDFVLLVQWVFEQQGLETINASVDERDGRVDLALINTKYKRDEFARVYFNKRGVPAYA